MNPLDAKSALVRGQLAEFGPPMPCGLVYFLLCRRRKATSASDWATAGLRLTRSPATRPNDLAMCCRVRASRSEA